MFHLHVHREFLPKVTFGPWENPHYPNFALAKYATFWPIISLMQFALWEFWAIYLIIANFSAIFAQKLALIKSIAQNLYKLNIFGTF